MLYTDGVNRYPLSHKNKLNSRQLLEKAMHKKYRHILIKLSNLKSYGELFDDCFINVGSVVLEKLIYVKATHTFVILIYAPFVTKF